MTETDRVDYHDPGAKVFDLPRPVSERKLRLLACAYCRHVWERVPPEGREAVMLAERYADGSATEIERQTALRAMGCRECGDASGGCWIIPGPLSVQIAVLTLALDTDLLVCREDGRAIAEVQDERTRHRVALCCRHALNLAEYQAQDERDAKKSAVGRYWNRIFSAASRRQTRGEEIGHQEMLFRDIFGNPFRPVFFSPSWRTDTAVSLARQMYAAGDFSAMPILADALQDAGCDHADILDHCRDPKQVHVRGCWVADLVLGRS